MTTELEIAEVLIRGLRSSKTKPLAHEEYRHDCEMHKSSCSRFLKFLKGKEIKLLVHDADIGTSHEKYKPIELKITDLKQAVEEYNKNGI